MERIFSYIFLRLIRCKMSIMATPRRQKIITGNRIGVRGISGGICCGIVELVGTPENEKGMVKWWRHIQRLFMRLTKNRWKME